MKLATKQFKIIIITIASILGAFLVACGSDSGSDADMGEVEEVKTVHGLGECKGANEGVTKLVTSENKYDTCSNGQWDVSGSKIDTVQTEDDLTACLEKYESDSAFVISEMSVFRCQSGKWKNRGFRIGEYETKSKLPACKEKFDGLKGFVKEDSTVYLCDSKAWKAWADAYASDEELPNCSQNREGNVAWILDGKLTLVCEDGAWESYVEQPPKSSSSMEKSETDSSSGSSARMDDSSSSISQVMSSSSASNSEQSSDQDGSIYNASTNTLTDLRDGQIYRTVKIGEQLWMAENLNYCYLGPTTTLDSSSFCYDNDPTNCDIYGRLYKWSAAMDSAGIIKGNSANGCGYGWECTRSENVRGVCPKGWHLPKNVEWEALIAFVGGSSVAGLSLKSTNGWYERENGTSGDGLDSFGFSALPAGFYYLDRSFDSYGFNARFWSVTQSGYGGAYYMALFSDYDDAGLDEFSKYHGASVRCIKDY